ncbi:hypothetical protein HZU75_15230 [Chitinibacter fontanus]|uniref:Uncharacterized protein n=1 Tax=Chitinibacter fontanus TaxID=1737446 RepID=A0A7D5Z923_9NEIS|nr:hypothetical protein [Chitinibacter fontanus]QLI82763.1 hypothetical protein HZU75_15230 [Chitinibacter fontanus]
MLVSTDCPWRRAVREVIGKVLSRSLFELRDGSAQRVLRRLANCRTDGVSRRSGAQGLLGVGQDPPLTRPAGETAGLPRAQQAIHGLQQQNQLGLAVMRRGTFFCCFGQEKQAR